jgi:biotin---protein ligase
MSSSIYQRQFVSQLLVVPFPANPYRSNQRVTLTTTTPHEELMIKSITLDHGLLRCVKVDSGRSAAGDYGGEDRTSSWMRPGGTRSTEYVDLQPDGNSFDLMSGMIKKKT